MKTFQLFLEDAESARASLENLNARRELAMKKNRETSGTFKDRMRKAIKKMKKKNEEHWERIHKKEKEVKEKRAK